MAEYMEFMRPKDRPATVVCIPHGRVKESKFLHGSLLPGCLVSVYDKLAQPWLEKGIQFYCD